MRSATAWSSDPLAAGVPAPLPEEGYGCGSAPASDRLPLVCKVKWCGATGRRRLTVTPSERAYFLSFGPVSLVFRAAMKASWGTSTRPTIFIRFLPAFCFSSSLRLRLMSPP